MFSLCSNKTEESTGPVDWSPSGTHRALISGGWTDYLLLQSVLELPLVAGCSTGHKLCLLHVSRWDVDQTKRSKYTLNQSTSF